MPLAGLVAGGLPFLTGGGLTGCVATGGVVTDGVVTAGVVTDGVVTAGVVTGGTVIDGTVTDGTVIDGIVTDGVLIGGRICRPVAAGGSTNSSTETVAPNAPARIEPHATRTKPRPAGMRPKPFAQSAQLRQSKVRRVSLTLAIGSVSGCGGYVVVSDASSR